MTLPGSQRCIGLGTHQTPDCSEVPTRVPVILPGRAGDLCLGEERSDQHHGLGAGAWNYLGS